jgi:hypothetical protein
MLVYVLKYTVKMEDKLMEKIKVFSDFEEANKYQLEYNPRFSDRKIVDFSIEAHKVISKIKERDPKVDSTK